MVTTSTFWASFAFLYISIFVTLHCADVKVDVRQANLASSTASPNGAGKVPKAQTKGGCYKGDLVCEKDKLGYEAITTLHQQMDDDKNGDIDLEESAEFLMEELQYSKSHWSDDRSKTFHMNDTHITVDDLWHIWKNSSVHNWTMEQVVAWLTYEVELPQYSETFKMNAVDGSTLPRLAVNNLNFVSNILGIKNLVHKQKLANKATDVVLFGPPKSRHNWYKDVALVTSVLVAVGGVWFAYRQNRQLEINMARTMRDMDSLAKSEQALKELQQKLLSEELEKGKHIIQNRQLEEKVERELSEARMEAQALKLTKEQTIIQLDKMKEIQSELERTKQALLVAQKELEVRSSLMPSVELQPWLQITFELELKAYNEKKAQADQKMLIAKDSCEKLRRKKQGVFGFVRMANSGYIDETDSMIITAKKALEEVKHDLAERQYRWQQIENVCSFSIISNPGIKALIQSTGHTDLYRYCHGGSLLDAAASTELDDFEDMPPTYGAVVAGPSRATTLTNKHLLRGLPTSSGPPSTAGSSRAGSEEPTHAATTAATDDQSSDELANGVHPTEDTGSEVAKPTFGLYDDQESTSSSSNDNNTTSIPARTRPKLQRNAALHTTTTDNMSICSEQVPHSSSTFLEEPIRTRTRTNESLPNLRLKKAQVASSPLALNTALSHSDIIVANGSTAVIKRSRTTDLPAKSRNIMHISVSSDCISKPGSAPASLNMAHDDSDTSLSSESKDSVATTATTAKRKVKKKIPLLNIFKSKQRTS